jgi:hypothetical protein
VIEHHEAADEHELVVVFVDECVKLVEQLGLRERRLLRAHGPGGDYNTSERRSHVLRVTCSADGEPCEHQLHAPHRLHYRKLGCFRQSFNFRRPEEKPTLINQLTSAKSS